MSSSKGIMMISREGMSVRLGICHWHKAILMVKQYIPVEASFQSHCFHLGLLQLFCSSLWLPKRLMFAVVLAAVGFISFFGYSIPVVIIQSSLGPFGIFWSHSNTLRLQIDSFGSCLSSRKTNANSAT